MDERDDSGVVEAEGPFEESLTPAVRPATDGHSGTGGDDDDAADIDPAELAGPRQTLEPLIQVVWTLQSSISALVLGAIAGAAFTILPIGRPLYGIGVFAAVLLVGGIFAVLRYRVWCYQVRTDSLYLRRGVLTRIQTVVPYVRIQHVDVRRGPIERTFGLATTVVYTAGSRGADVSIPGLTPERAEDLQDRLKRLAIAAEGEDAV
ncbi:MAG: PH domain-containing protein [Natronomonas sp.]